jgi:hypothetical protein
MSRKARGIVPPEAERFARCARRYCELVENHRATPIRRFLAEVHALLPELYALGMALPEVDPPDLRWPSRVPDPGWWTLFRGLVRRLGDRNLYMEVFDAYDRHDRTSLVGSLADDLCDIHRDLAEGLARWDAGHELNAIWDWKYLGETHWGEHATSALRALHWLKGHYEYGQPPPMPRPAERAPERPPAEKRRTARERSAGGPRKPR